MAQEVSGTVVEAPDIDTFGSSKNRKIRVSDDAEFMARAEVVCSLPLPQEAAWELLTHQDNHKIFRSIKVRQLRCVGAARSAVSCSQHLLTQHKRLVLLTGPYTSLLTLRHTIQRSGPRHYKVRNSNEQEYDVSHYIGWQVLWRKGEFETYLRGAHSRAACCGIACTSA